MNTQNLSKKLIACLAVYFGGLVRTTRNPATSYPTSKPTQNAYIERFNRSLRREVLNAHLFANLSEVREIIHDWMISYNEERPHASLGNLPPKIFKQQLTKPIIAA